jgi:predicted permease
MRLTREDPGFRRDGLISMRLTPPDGPHGGEADQRAAIFWGEALQAARALPGALSVALTSELPYTGEGIVTIYTPQGYESQENGVLGPVVVVAGDFFGTMGIPVLEGRTFQETEPGRASGEVIVNEAFVQQYWPGERGGGKRVKEGSPKAEDEGWYDVVGVVADVAARPGVEAPPTVYVPMNGEHWPAMDVVVRTDGDAAELAGLLRDSARRLHPGLPVTRLATVESLASGSLSRPRFYTGLFGGFALIALLLAVVGVYSTTAYATRSRTREIGIRLALGARRARVVRAVIRQTGTVIVFGVGVGLAGAALGAEALSSVLLSVGPRDGLTYGLVGAVVLTSGVLAAWVPARRASRVDPASTLREEG